MPQEAGVLNDRLRLQNQRLLQHLNTTRLCNGETQQLIREVLGQPLDETNHINLPFYTEYGRNISWGHHILIDRNVTLSDFKPIFLADNVEIGSGATLLTSSFRMTAQRNPVPWSAPITIKQNVKVGSHVLILPGVTIGENTIILPGAIISDTIPANSTIYPHQSSSEEHSPS